MNAAFQILRLPEVRERTALSRSSVYRLEAEGRFPKRIKLSAHAAGWIAAEVDQWISDRIAARDKGGAS